MIRSEAEEPNGAGLQGGAARQVGMFPGAGRHKSLAIRVRQRASGRRKSVAQRGTAVAWRRRGGQDTGLVRVVQICHDPPRAAGAEVANLRAPQGVLTLGIESTLIA